jgi:hypothetical protein
LRNVLVTLSILTLLSSCSSFAVKQQAEAQRNSLKAAVINSFTHQFAINIYALKSTSLNPDTEYISNAVPDILLTYLKPMENETVFVPFDRFQFELTPDIANIIIISNSIFSNYLTNIKSDFTQFTTNYSFVTNPVTLTNTNYSESFDTVKQRQIQNINLSFINTNIIVKMTNMTLSNIIHTNKNIIEKPQYLSLLKNEYPELISNFQYVPIVVNKVFDSAGTTNFTNYTSYLTGSFTVIKKRNGPNEISFQFKLKKFIYETNEITMNMASREDMVSDNLYDLLKTIRKFIINKTNGDIVVVTTPNDANIYLDGFFIGKSPLYYPAVPTGPHQISFLKEGYNQEVIQTVITENKTNLIQKSIYKLQTGGVVNIESFPTNSSVYVDSVFYGNTPVSLSNLTIGVDHRLKIQSFDTNFYPFFHVFKLNDTNALINIKSRLLPYEGTPASTRQLLWWGAYGSWALTLGCFTYAIYTHYQLSYYTDLYYAQGDSQSYNKLIYYQNLNNTATTFGTISGVLSLGVTAYALFNEEIYMGLQYQPQNKETSVTVAMMF